MLNFIYRNVAIKSDLAEKALNKAWMIKIVVNFSPIK